MAWREAAETTSAARSAARLTRLMGAGRRDLRSVVVDMGVGLSVARRALDPGEPNSHANLPPPGGSGCRGIPTPGGSRRATQRGGCLSRSGGPAGGQSPAFEGRQALDELGGMRRGRPRHEVVEDLDRGTIGDEARARRWPNAPTLQAVLQAERRAAQPADAAPARQRLAVAAPAADRRRGPRR